MPRPLTRLALFGDSYGIPVLLTHLPAPLPVAIVAASNRPTGHEPLRRIAADHSIPFLIQPAATDSHALTAFHEALTAQAPDGLLCYSYSMLVRPPTLALVQGNAFNLHSSLLPKNRGPNPIQWALIHGESETGMSLHLMAEGFDTGAIIAQHLVTITPDDTWITLSHRVNAAASPLLAQALPSLLAGTWKAIPQEEAASTTNPRIPPESLPIRFAQMDDLRIYNLIRAQVAPLRGAYIDTPQGRVHITQPMTHHHIAALRREYA